MKLIVSGKIHSKWVCFCRNSEIQKKCDRTKICVTSGEYDVTNHYKSLSLNKKHSGQIRDIFSEPLGKKLQKKTIEWKSAWLLVNMMLKFTCTLNWMLNGQIPHVSDEFTFTTFIQR